MVLTTFTYPHKIIMAAVQERVLVGDHRIMHEKGPSLIL